MRASYMMSEVSTKGIRFFRSVISSEKQLEQLRAVGAKATIDDKDPLGERSQQPS